MTSSRDGQHRTEGASTILPSTGARPHTARYAGTCMTCGKDYAPGAPLLIVENAPHHPGCVGPASDALEASPAAPPAVSSEAQASDRILVRCFRKGFGGRGDEELRLTLSTHQGARYVSARVWFRVGQEWRPSKKGLSVKLRELRAVADALGQLAEELEADNASGAGQKDAGR